jgi:PAS domain S-box-containing protein
VEPSIEAFFDLSPNLLCIRRQDGYFQMVNQAWTIVLGWSEEELRSQPWLEFIHTDDILETVELDRRCCTTTKTAVAVEYESRFRHKDGSYRWLAWRLSPYRGGYSYGIAQDVTSRSWIGSVAYRSGLQEALKLREQAIAASSVGIVIADARLADMPLIYVNPAFEHITGYSAVEVLGTNCRFLQGPEKNQPAIQELRQAIRAGKDCTVMLRNYRKNGQFFWNELHISPIHNAEGTLTHFVGVQSDVTARKLAEDSLQAEQEISERLLLNILPKSIADQLKTYQLGLTQRDGRPFIAEGFEQVSVLFADIVGFTEVSSHTSPADIVSLLNRVFSLFDDLCEHYNVEKIKTIGDAYMVASGLPQPRPDHLEVLADMALDMQTRITSFAQREQLDLVIRIGMHTGSVVAGVIGTKKFTYDLWGDTVNIASRMESQGLPGKIQVTDTVYNRLHDRYQLEPRGRIAIKGKGEMTTYWLTGKHPHIMARS